MVLVYVVMVWYGMLCYVMLRYVTLLYVMQINQPKAVNVIGIQNTWAMTGNKQSLLSTER